MEEEEEGGGFSARGLWLSLQDLLLHLLRTRCSTPLEALLE